MARVGDRMSLDAARSGGPVERDIEQAITALKKGACLLKYGRRGKPKFCPFRLSNDESILIWFSGKEEKNLKLSHVSRIISGQRTPIFHRYPRPEKEYQSFSLIYSDRSLDIICKDKDEAEVWFSSLKALISRSRQRKWGTESRSEGISSGANSPRTYTRRSSPLHSPFSNFDSLMKDGNGHLRLHSPYGSPRRNGQEKGLSDLISYALPPKGFLPSDSASGSLNSLSSGVGSDGLPCQVKTMGMDAFRVSLSSAVSSSSQGSGHDDGDALGDVFLWGEGTGGDGGPSIKSDCLVPKPLESAVVLDVQSIACGRLHAALVTRNGEVFSWGEESGGRLGHGVDSDVQQPKLVDALSATTIELLSCGEYHSCAVTLSGDLYTWGDGRSGILGHGNEVNQWVPKRVKGSLEGLHVSSIACGPWHTAVVTSAGQLFTFGEGTFGALGHGDCTSVSRPREIDSLKGLRTVRAACGAWHSAAVVEVMVGNSSSSNCSSGKIFTWGDGDKGSLGHVEDKEPKLVPTCVAALVDPNFCQVACGHSMTVALTTSGQVYTMGSPVYGQLGNPNSDTKLPRRVEGKLAKVFIEDITCGEYHVAVLTSRTEVYTWGKGANGRLGHGDTDDRSSPTLVESLKDKQVKSIACGTSFTAAICLHKWVSGVDQSMCSGCRLIFNFTRKRHNCYNCGLVFCNSCSSKKSIRASMAPNPNKPYRVCDNCYVKLKKIIETDNSSHSRSNNQRFNSLLDKDEKSDTRSRPYLSRLSSMESTKQMENRVSPIPNGNSKSLNPVFVPSKKFFSASVPGSRIASRATSPISSRLSPTRSTTPTPTLGGLTTNDSLLSQEVNILRAQVENLTARAKLQEAELERTTKQLKEAIAIAGEETAKSKAAKEVIKSLTAQVKEMAERMPVGAALNVKIPMLTSVRPNNDSGDISYVSNEKSNGNAYCHSLPNGSISATNHNSRQNKQNQPENEVKNGGARSKETDSLKDNEWVEQDEPGVYITLTSLPGGSKDLKRVRFSRKRFSEKQAEVWWAENRTRIYEHYNIRMADKSSFGLGSEDLTL